MNNQENIMQQVASESQQQPLRILVVGATGGSGRATVARLLEQGHIVTAYSRSAQQLTDDSGRLITINGDVTQSAELDRAMHKQQVVIVTLGITENPLRVRFFGSASTADNVRSLGTANVISAMQKQGVKRLIVQSSFGVGETRGLLGFVDQLFFSLILQPQIADTEAQEKLVRNSGLDWTIAQPVHLTDEDSSVLPFLSEQGQTRLMKVARQSVAGFLAAAAQDVQYIGRSVVVSG